MDIDLCKKNGEYTGVYAYCHQHNVDGQFMVNYFLNVQGNFRIIDKKSDDSDNIEIHCAHIEKLEDGTYEICGVGAWIHFEVIGELNVCELTETEYSNQIKR